MEINQLFLQRHQVLYDFYLNYLWEIVSPELMRQRPHPRVNSIAWIMWHLTRTEDASLNRFVAGRPQVLDEGNWMSLMDVPWRHVGTGMTLNEVDDLSQRINLQALHEYSISVRARTVDIVNHLDPAILDTIVPVEHIRSVVIDEGYVHSEPEGLVKNYTGWSKGRFLMTHGLTHSFQHLGEMEVITALLDINYD